MSKTKEFGGFKLPVPRITSDGQDYHIIISGEFLAQIDKGLNGAHPLAFFLALLGWFMTTMLEVFACRRAGGARWGRKKGGERRKGSVQRLYETPVGVLEVHVPRFAGKGGLLRNPFEKALRGLKGKVKEAVATAHFLGIGTRRAAYIMKCMGLEPVSNCSVSRWSTEISKELTREFQGRSLDGLDVAVMYLDALYESVRVGGRYVRMAVIVASGITAEGDFALLGVWVTANENRFNYTKALRGLASRGLRAPRLIVSDAHPGIQEAIRRFFPGCAWQRCAIHLIRDVLKGFELSERLDAYRELTDVWAAPTVEEALERARAFLDAHSDTEKHREAALKLVGGLRDALTYKAFSGIPWRRLWSSNRHERLNRRIRMRTKNGSPYPTEKSYLRAVVAGLRVDFGDGWVRPGAAEPGEVRGFIESAEALARSTAGEVGSAGPMEPEGGRAAALFFASRPVRLRTQSGVVANGDLYVCMSVDGAGVRRVATPLLLAGGGAGEVAAWVGRAAGELGGLGCPHVVAPRSDPLLLSGILGTFRRGAIQTDIDELIADCQAAVPGYKDGEADVIKANIAEIRRETREETLEVARSVARMLEPFLPEVSALIRFGIMPCVKWFGYAKGPDDKSARRLSAAGYLNGMLDDLLSELRDGDGLIAAQGAAEGVRAGLAKLASRGCMKNTYIRHETITKVMFDYTPEE